MQSRCNNENFFDRNLYQCQRCETKYAIMKGYQFTDHCGWSDEGQQIGNVYRPCGEGTFNDGSQAKCQNCRDCSAAQTVGSACVTDNDTVCCKQGEQYFNGECIPQPPQTTRMTVKTTMRTTAKITTSVASSSPSPSPSPSPQAIFPHNFPSTQNPIPAQSVTPAPQGSTHSHFVAVYVCFGILSTLALACLFLFLKRRTKPFNKELKKCCNGASHESLSKRSIARYEQALSYNIIHDGNNDHVTGLPQIAPVIQNAPLKTVLNNLDVLEELWLVLDPDISGAKNTRHLAAQCSFSFAWINYAYSMKDHKSPLVAVLEGVVTKNPDWTVGHLAERLTAIGRNDAVEILAKLSANVLE